MARVTRAPRRRRASSPRASSPRPSTPSPRSSCPTATSRGRPGGHTDPWNLVEAAMALDLGGRHDEARARVRVARAPSSAPTAAGTPTTSATTSRTPRSTPTSPATSRPACGTTTSSPATPRYLAGSGRRSRRRSTSRSTSSARPARSRGAATTPTTARCSPGRRASTCQPEVRDRDRRAPRARAPRLGAVARRARDRHRAPSRRVPRQGPLGDGLVLPDPRRRAARRRRRTRASPTALGAFVVDGRGVRCVSDRPWITAAETCELVMALDAIGATTHARVDSSRRCSSSAPTAAATGPARTSTTSASTSTASSTPRSSPRGTPPPSCSPRTRSAATGRRAGLFRGERLPEGLTAAELLAAGVEIERER